MAVDGEWPELTRDEAAKVAPLKTIQRLGIPFSYPDMYNHLPTRFVTLAEARARGWRHFYVGDICPRGHKAPRAQSNPSMCVDCHRINEGRGTIGIATAPETRTTQTRVEGKPTRELPRADVPGEPTAMEKTFLAEYAECKEFDKACKRIRVTPGYMHARLSWSKPLQVALAELEERLGVEKTAPIQLHFDWDNEKRDLVVRVYVDTGDIAEARQVVRVSPTEFYKELKSNPKFAQAIKDAEPLAHKVLQERAMSEALNGNDKLLVPALKAYIPEFTKPVEENNGDIDRRSSEDLAADIARVIGLARYRLSENAAVHADPHGVDGAAQAGDAQLQTGSGESMADLL